jgi:hypothetical protein
MNKATLSIRVDERKIVKEIARFSEEEVSPVVLETVSNLALDRPQFITGFQRID